MPEQRHHATKMIQVELLHSWYLWNNKWPFDVFITIDSWWPIPFLEVIGEFWNADAFLAAGKNIKQLAAWFFDMARVAPISGRDNGLQLFGDSVNLIHLYWTLVNSVSWTIVAIISCLYWTFRLYRHLHSLATKTCGVSRPSRRPPGAAPRHGGANRPAESSRRLARRPVAAAAGEWGLNEHHMLKNEIFEAFDSFFKEFLNIILNFNTFIL